MDQTVCRFDMAPSQTNNRQGPKFTHGATIGAAKQGFNVALCALANGMKKPALIVFKENSGNIPPRVMQQLNIPHNVRVKASGNGWMTSALMLWWTENIWESNVDDVRRLLVLDQARIHTMSPTRDALDGK